MNLRSILYVLIIGATIAACSRTIDERAAAGDPEAQRRLAEAYEFGDSLHIQSYDSAFVWYERAALQGDTIALPRMIRAYYDGAYIPRNLQKAYELALIGDSLDIAEAQYYMSIFYDKNIIVDTDRKKALEYKQIAAEKNNAHAITALAYNIQHGIEIDKNVDKAIELYKRAAELGDPKVMKALADIYDPENPVEYLRDEFQHASWRDKHQALVKKMADAGDYDAAVDLAWTYIGTPDAPMGLALLRQIADSTGYYRAIGDIGKVYIGDPAFTKIQSDFVAAAPWFEKGVALEYDEAMWGLSLLKRAGQGTPRDFEGALKLAIRSAEMGNRMGLNILTSYYLNNGYCGVPMDYEQAFKWTVIGAELDDANMQFRLGHYYENGDGTEIDYDKAQYWYRRAFDNGQKSAAKELAKYANDYDEFAF